MKQTAPDPEILHELVDALTYRPGWRFELRDIDRGQGSEGLTLVITTSGYNSYHRPAQYPHRWDHEGVCLDCGEPFPCKAYRFDSQRDDSPTGPYCVNHFMPVPPASFDERSWRRWLFEQCLLVERHEACEFFTIRTDKPYAPNHGPGNDPYIVAELTTDEARRTSFRGIVKGEA